MKRIGFYLIMIIGMMLCWGCGDHKITESTETEAGLPEYKMAQLDLVRFKMNMYASEKLKMGAISG